MSAKKLDTIIASLSNTSGSFEEYVKRVQSIMNALNKCKKLETELNSLTEMNKKLNDDKLNAEKKLKDCNDVRNKTDYVKMKQDFEKTIADKESKILALTNENRALQSDIKAATSKSIEMVPMAKKDIEEIGTIPSDFKKKCNTIAGQKEMMALADKYIRTNTQNKDMDEHYHKIGLIMKEKCFNRSTKKGGKLARKSKRTQKSRK